jgi:arylsulfatase A-like enzyme
MKALSLVLSLVVVGVVIPANAGVEPEPVEDPRPNVLIIVTDDQRAEDYLPVMPNVRARFVEGGVRYPHAFVTTPLCCPSRGSIFSGRYAHNHGVLVNNQLRELEAFDHGRTMQCGLQAAGYHTAMAGKFFNAWRLANAPPCFERWALMNAGYRDPRFNVDGVVGPQTGYSTDLLGGFAADHLDAFEADDEAPWFLYVAPNAPHSPFLPAPQHALDAVPPWQPDASAQESDRSDKPPVVQRVGQDPARAEPIRQAQLRTLMSVDDLVGNLFDRLDALGETDDTLAFFLSDNGLLWGDHGIVGTKRFPYLGSVQVPFLARWPGHLPSGGVDDRFVANIDIAPTVFDATGTPAPGDPGFDGVSLLWPGSRDRLSLEYFLAPDAPGVPAWASTVTDGYQYVQWYADDGTTVTFREYYDLLADPWELENLLGDADPANDPDVTAIAERLAVDRACAGSTCPRPEPMFADAFDQGLAGWPDRGGLSIAPDFGHLAPPAAIAVAAGTAAFGVHALQGSEPSVCLRAAIDLSAIGRATTLLRLRAPSGAGVAQVLATRTGDLRVRSEPARRTFDPGVAMPPGWHTVELCAATGPHGILRLAFDGRPAGAWEVDLGVEPFGEIQVFDERPSTFAAALDDVQVATDPGGPATVR